MKQRLQGTAGLLLLLMPLATPAAIGAQAGPPRPVTVRAAVAPTQNMCLRLSGMPSDLVRTPEGQLIIRMQRELDDATVRMRMDSAQYRQIVVVKGSLDSVGRMIAGTPEVGGGRFVISTVPGSPLPVVENRRAFETEMTQRERVQVAERLREIQPRIAELVRVAPPEMIDGTLNISLNTLGYVGLTASAGTFPTSIDYMRPFAYCDYPRVESVEPGSPADKAGMLAGDTLLAYNERDLRQYNVNYPDLLIPGKPLAIRYRRDGRVGNASMIVAERDTSHGTITSFSTTYTACTPDEVRNGCRSESVITRGGGFGTVSGGGFMSSSGMVVAADGRAPQSTGAVRRTTTGTMTMVSPQRAVIVADGSDGIRFQGVLMREISERTAKNLGTDAGLVVFGVPDNSQAFLDGLRTGDHIVRANGMAVRDIVTFRAVVQRLAPGDRQMVVNVTSKSGGPRAVTLRW